ncbi:RidA family protein [uncultured Roseobacter sp.]|uniref:RidA family protein n=1 Tax=uncultured Roseobacter sp. TaxID=114847 RepID=UPI0026059D5E|nr:RidA family protein [uncultured Roseobacter sp.]
MAHRIINPPDWAPAKGYANGVLTEDGLLFTGGQIGWTDRQEFEAHEFVGQMAQALKNIRTIVETAGGTVADITRMTWYITDKKEYLSRQREVGAAYREIFGRHFPAMAVVVVSGLIEDEALVEIEATAVIRR